MSQRLAKLQSVLRQEIAQAIVPLLTGAVDLFTITSVEVTPDLRQTTVWFEAVKPDADVGRILKFLQSIRVQLQAKINQRSKIKFTPLLKFKYDRGVENVEKISAILNRENT